MEGRATVGKPRPEGPEDPRQEAVNGRVDESQGERTRLWGPDHPGPLKQAMGVAGFRVGTGRPPLRPISEDRLKAIALRLQALGLVNPRDTARAPR